MHLGMNWADGFKHNTGLTAGFSYRWFMSCTEQQMASLPKPKEKLQHDAASHPSPSAFAADGVED